MNSNSTFDLKQESIAFLKQFFKVLTLQFAIYILLRAGFIAYNISQLNQVKPALLASAFMAGLRFDLAVIGPIVTLTFLMTLWLSANLSSFFAFLFLIIQSFFISINVGDYELVHFVGRRFNKSIMDQMSEGFSGNFIYYYKLAVIDAILIGLLIFFSIKFFQFRNRYHLKFKLLASLFLVTFGVISARGGFSQKPISFVDANKIPFNHSQHIVLNSTYTLLKSLTRPAVEKHKYFSTTEALQYLNLQKNSSFNKDLFGSYKGKNVVLIIVESLSSEYINEINTPFLNQLKYKSVFFDPAFANGRRSVEGVAAIIAGVPALMDESFINSEFAANQFVGLGTLLKNENYNTHFFHGGKNGTMRFDTFTKAAGYDQYYGLTEYDLKNPSTDFGQNDNYDGTWGIYDEPFLKYNCEVLSTLKTPFLSTVFTLSSHVPYKVPEKFQPSNKASVQPGQDILKAINYTDFALAQFFECAQKQPYFQDTLFIITADHTGPRLKKNELRFRELFEIPLYFYSYNNDMLKKISTAQIAQQIDILPTILDLIGIPQVSKNHLARSLLYAGPKVSLLYSENKFELFSSVPLSDENKKNTVKAMKQYFSEGMYDNRLYFPIGSVQ